MPTQRICQWIWGLHKLYTCTNLGSNDRLLGTTIECKQCGSNNNCARITFTKICMSAVCQLPGRYTKVHIVSQTHCVFMSGGLEFFARVLKLMLSEKTGHHGLGSTLRIALVSFPRSLNNSNNQKTTVDVAGFEHCVPVCFPAGLVLVQVGKASEHLLCTYYNLPFDDMSRTWDFYEFPSQKL